MPLRWVRMVGQLKIVLNENVNAMGRAVEKSFVSNVEAKVDSETSREPHCH